MTPRDKIIEQNIFQSVTTEVDVAKLKRRIMRDAYWTGRIMDIRKKINNKVDKADTMPNNPELLALYHELVTEGVVEKNTKTEHILKRLKVRSNSGVAVVSLLTKPYTCPGRCIYCPTEKNMPKSYLSREPAAARALINKFDPYKQIWMRLKALTMNGHPIDKVEMILIGGTWNFYKKEYQEWFVKESFRACNNWGLPLEKQIPSDHTLSLTELQNRNETAVARIIGLSIETRPDYITPSELKWLRYLGVTKVELGVQHLDNTVLEFNRREMTREAIAEGTELLRQYGFKIVYHMMPNLPTSNPEMDVQMFKDLYSGLDFHPDMMKIYPNMVLRGSLLYKLVTQKKIEYTAYDDELLTRVLADCESYVPEYTRLIRVIRDIPADYIIVGSKKSNLREMVDAYQAKRGVKQVDIRAREIRDTEIDPNDFILKETIYETREGKEYFLQFVSEKEISGKHVIAGFLRLRLPNKQKNVQGEKKQETKEQEQVTRKNWGLDKWRAESEAFAVAHPDKIDEMLENSALVRELHVYGQLRPIGEEGVQSQHTGMGKKLLARAEAIAQGDNVYGLHYDKLAIISGVGVRDYYRRRGYELEETYMVKRLPVQGK